MATAGSILNNVRIAYGDDTTTPQFITDAVGLEWLSVAQERFVNEVLALDEVKDYGITANVRRYDLPDDCIIPVSMMWRKQATRKLDAIHYAEMDQVDAAWPNTTASPRFYTVLRRQIVLGPGVPNANSATALASGESASTATTIGLTAASGTFRSRGFLKNEDTSEVVEYTGVATTTVTGCIRGIHGTDAASVASGDQWKEVDLQMTYRKSPAAMTATTASPEIPAAWHRYLEQYLLYLAWRNRGDMSKAQVAYNEFEVTEKMAKEKIGRRFMEPIHIRDRRWRNSRWNYYGY